MKSILISTCLLALVIFNHAQSQDSTKKALQFSGFVDTYFGYDFNNPHSKLRPHTVFNHNRHNEFAVNLALIQANCKKDKMRANIGLMAGTYAQYNLAHEPAALQNIYEAVVGYELSSGLWLDAGIFSSHLGFESAISMDNLTLTRSLVAESSPYYLSGAKLTYDKPKNWTFQLSISNGWQNMVEIPGNNNKAIGTQVVYSPNEDLLINWSTFISNEHQDSAKQFRYFNDLYITKDIGKFNFIAGVDYGIEENSNSSILNTWWGMAFICQYEISEKLKTAARYEYFQDNHGIAIAQISQNGYQGPSASLNLDYLPNNKFAIRAEGKYIQNIDPIFELGNGMLSNTNVALLLSIAMKLD